MPIVGRLIRTNRQWAFFYTKTQKIGGNLSERKGGNSIERQSNIAVDGKTVRGSHGRDKKAIHLLSAFLHEEKVVIAQREVKKTNEIPELKNLLSPLNIKGTNVTTDAMHTQVESATFIVREKEANYTMIVKDNQPTLKKQLEASLGNQAFSPSDILSPFRNG